MDSGTQRHAEAVMVRGEHASRGDEGQVLLVNGERMAMRLWQDEKAGASKGDHSNPYEYVAYVIKGRVRVTMNNHTFEVAAGDSYCVPANTTYSLEIVEQATVVEATSPSDRGDVTSVA